MIIVLGDIIADLSLRIQNFPLNAGDLQRAEFIDLGPGGAANVAIMAAHLGLEVSCLGEIGDDIFGQLLLESLRSESVLVDGLLITASAQTPVAGVLVDRDGEPAYVGHRGSLKLRALPDLWRSTLKSASALFADGWVDQDGVPEVILQGLQVAREAGVPRFFDPGPGNVEYDLQWRSQAASLATVTLLNGEEALALTGAPDYQAAAAALLEGGTELVAVKLGREGCHLIGREGSERVPAFQVTATDATGAGDSFDAAVIYGYLEGWPLRRVALLANAVGAAKVQKMGTGHQMPTRDEVRGVLERFDVEDLVLREGLS